MPLRLDETHVRRDEQRAEKNDVVADRGLPPYRERIARDGSGGDDQRDRERPNLIEMLLDDDAGAGRDQHDAEPGQRPQLVTDRDDVAAFANQHQSRIRLQMTTPFSESARLEARPAMREIARSGQTTSNDAAISP